MKNLKKIFIFLFIIFTIIIFSEETIVHIWTKEEGTKNFDEPYGMAIDDNENIFICGNIEVGCLTNGIINWNIKKYDSNGNRIWAKENGTVNNDVAYGIAIDSSDNIYITGYTEGDLDGNTNAGGSDIFLMKYDSNGNKIWTREIGTSENDEGYGLTIDSSDNIYITGYTEGDLDGNTNAGGSDIFLMKYDSNGNKIWTREIGTANNEIAYGIAIDSFDNIYITGYTNGNLDGNTNAGGSDIFLMKYDSIGNKIWAREIGTANNEIAYGIAINSSDDIYITGYTNGNLDGNTNTGGSDIFLMKYDSNGNKIWTREIGTIDDDKAFDLTNDEKGNIFIIGYLKEGSFGDLLICGFRKAGQNIILLKYSSNGDKVIENKYTYYGSKPTGIKYFNEFIYVIGYSFSIMNNNVNEGLDDLFLIKFKDDILSVITGSGLFFDNYLNEYVYHMVYNDYDNDIQMEGYPKLHILKNGQEIKGSPFTMTYEYGNYINGAYYTYTTKLEPSSSYSYYFESYDIYGVPAIGNSITYDGPIVLSDNLNNLKVYPNPYNKNENNKIIFENIPAGNTKIKIYNISGEKVFEINKDITDGKYEWDIKNNNNHTLSSGIYFYIISDESNNRKMGKLAIIK